MALLATGACTSHTHTPDTCPTVTGFGVTSSDGLVVQGGDPGFGGTGVVTINYATGAPEFGRLISSEVGLKAERKPLVVTR